MQLDVKDNYFNFIVADSKTKHLSIMYQIKKNSKYDYLNLKLLSGAMKKRMNDLDQHQFMIYKIDNYDSYFDIELKDHYNYILIEYSLNFICIDDIDENELYQMFENFIKDYSFDKSELLTQINTEKLILKDLKQNHRSYALKLSNDIIYKENSLYLSFLEKQEYLEKIDLSSVDFTVLKNLKNRVIFKKTLKGEDYQSQKLVIDNIGKYNIKASNDIISDQNIDQSIVVLNFEISDKFSKVKKNTFNSLFGSGAHSLLFKIIREQNKLCYYVYSTISNDNLKVVTGIKQEKIQFFIEQINEIINDFKNYYSDENLSIAKKMLINSYLKKENEFGFNYALVQNNLYNKTTYDISQIVKEISEVNSEDIFDIITSIKYKNKVVLK